MKVSVKFEVRIPETNVTTEQIEEWLRLELHDNGLMKAGNPLDKYNVEPIFGTFDWREIK